VGAEHSGARSDALAELGRSFFTPCVYKYPPVNMAMENLPWMIFPANLQGLGDSPATFDEPSITTNKVD